MTKNVVKTAFKWQGGKLDGFLKNRLRLLIKYRVDRNSVVKW